MIQKIVLALGPMMLLLGICVGCKLAERWCTRKPPKTTPYTRTLPVRVIDDPRMQ